MVHKKNSSSFFGNFSKEEVIADYRLAFKSRAASLIGRKEVLTGKAKFGIFGDGKEIPQIAMAKAFEPGDFRSGYYRDQTFMFAIGALTFEQFFAQLYGTTDLKEEPASGGRQMTAHFATPLVNEKGEWKHISTTKNSSSDISPTGAQMGRVIGLAYASKLYRNNKNLHGMTQFSHQGSEVAFATIGNASTSEGLFFETLNAAGVLQVPLVVSVWDDGYGISVPNTYQTTKGSISEILKGFHPQKGQKGVGIHVVKAWDYPAICELYQEVVENTRKHHAPALIHVIEVTQPQGHSTSGSHERYKSKERLEWEKDYCCIARLKKAMLQEKIATNADFDVWEQEDQKEVENAKNAAWKKFMDPMQQEKTEALNIITRASQHADQDSKSEIQKIAQGLERPVSLTRKLVQSSLFQSLSLLRNHLHLEDVQALQKMFNEYRSQNEDRYCSQLYSNTLESPLRISSVAPRYSENSEEADGRMVLLRCFEKLFERDPRVFIIGEDVGYLGDVNQVFQGLQEKFGEIRITDTGIREATIFGQGLGSAMRGLRPIVDIQYLDYLLYALQLMSDDLSSLRYRTCGKQKAPVIIRTKGHRLEGIWHAGSPMGTILSACRGIHVCVPRNMVQAAGMYNTLFEGDDPALVIEVLNGYRLKEKIPDNLGEIKVALGQPETIREGTDLTIVTYGACCRVAQEAAQQMQPMGIDVEIIDVQTLLPFDREHSILSSIKKTNALLCLDEDVPGGASAYMMQEILEKQNAYDYLDARPRTLSAKPNRPAYGTDGDYFCKPSAEDVVEVCYAMMRERFPKKFPSFVV